MSNETIWKESPNTKRVIDYYYEKYGQMVTPVGLVKSLSVVSLKVKNCFPLNIISVAPSGHFKSRLSIELFEIFGKKSLVNFGSDFTIHSLARDYDKGLKIDNKCCLINDLTLLLSSKSKKTKERLINGLAELLSEGSYAYSDFSKGFTLKALISIIGNITLESYTKYNRELIESTFGERCLTVFHQLNEQEERSFNLNKQKRISMEFGDKLKFKGGLVKYDHEINRLNEIAMKWKILSLSPSGTRTFDRVISVITSNALLNGRNKVIDEDFIVLDLLEGHLKNPMIPHLNIIQLAMQGLSQNEICVRLGRDPIKYQPYISKIIREYKVKGVVPNEY